MLKLKKLFLAMMVAAVAVTGFVSCSNDDDDEDTPDSDPTQTYTVSYSSAQGTAPSAITVDENTVLNSDQLPTLSATGYTFNGWYDGETQAVAGTYKVTGNVALTASWGLTYVIGNYTVVVYDNNTATATNSEGTAVSATISDSTLTISDGDTSYTATVTDGTLDTSSVKDSSESSVSVAETVDAQTNLYGTYTGTVNSVEATIIISADGVGQGGNYGTYTKVLWVKDTDGNYVVAAQSDSTNTKNGDLTVANYTTASSCYITFGTDSDGNEVVTYRVPGMIAYMGEEAGTAVLTRTLPATAEAQSDLYGTYTGSMTVMGTASEVSLTIADGKFTLNSGHPATYTKILWLKDADGNYVVAAQSDTTNSSKGDLTVLNYTTASSNYVVFGTDAITYYVPAMASMGGTCTLTKLPYTVDAQTDLYGTYTGTMTVGTTSVESTVTIAEGSVSQGSYGTYTKILWLRNDDGNYVVAAQSDSTNTSNGDLTVANYTTAASCYITFGDTISYTIPKMGTSMTLTKSSTESE